MKTIKKLNILIILILSMLNISAQDGNINKLNRSEGKDEFIDVGGYKLQYQKLGKGNPAIVFLNGGSAKMNYWDTITDNISTSFSVIKYERAGHDKSEMGRKPRHGLNIARELKVLLGKLSIPEPYIIVAHSAGCMYARIFVAEYPESVAGMLLLDPGDKDFLDSFGNSYLNHGLKLKWDNYWNTTWNTLAKRQGGFGKEVMLKETTIKQMLERNFPADLRLYIVSGLDAKRPSYFIRNYGNDIIKKYYEFVNDYHKSLLLGLKNGKHIPLYDAGHIIHHNRPDVVIDLILEIAGKVEVNE